MAANAVNTTYDPYALYVRIKKFLHVPIIASGFTGAAVLMAIAWSRLCVADNEVPGFANGLLIFICVILTLATIVIILVIDEGSTVSLMVAVCGAAVFWALLGLQVLIGGSTLTVSPGTFRMKNDGTILTAGTTGIPRGWFNIQTIPVATEYRVTRQEAFGETTVETGTGVNRTVRASATVTLQEGVALEEMLRRHIALFKGDLSEFPSVYKHEQYPGPLDNAVRSTVIPILGEAIQNEIATIKPGQTIDHDLEWIKEIKITSVTSSVTEVK